MNRLRQSVSVVRPEASRPPIAPFLGMNLALLLVLASALPALAILEFEKGELSGELTGSVQMTGPIRFVQDTPSEAPSLLVLLKSDLRAGQRVGFSGEIRTGYCGSSRSPDNEGLWVRWDEVYPSKDRYLEVSEAHLDLYLSNLDLRLGVQKFSWGTLDQFNPTDNLSPLDLRNLFSPDPLERKIGVPALRALYGSVAASVQIELVWIPCLVPYRFPDPGDRWYPPLFQAPETLEVDLPDLPFKVPLRIRQFNEEPDLPGRTIGHSELGVRLARTLGTVDLGLSYFNGYDRRPVIRADGVVVSDFVILPPQADFSYLLQVRPDFHRMQVFGMDVAASRGLFTFRAEAAYIKNRRINMGLSMLDELVDRFRFPPLSDFTWVTRPDGFQLLFPYSPEISFAKNVLSAGGGLDYQWGTHLLSFQVVGEKILNHHGENLIYEELELFLVFGTLSRFMEDRLHVESGLVHNPMQELWIGSVDTSYSFTDALTAGFHLLLLDGKSRSPFGQFKRNDQVEFWVRWSF